MKPVFITAALLLCFSISFGQNADVDMIKKLNSAWIHCYQSRDTLTLSKIFADDIILISPAGKKFKKKEILNNVVSRQKFTSAIVDTAEVRLFGNIALINATASYTFVNDNKTVHAKTNYLDVYEKRKGKWVAVEAHVTSLQ